jgi:hypothetical protein
MNASYPGGWKYENRMLPHPGSEILTNTYPANQVGREAIEEILSPKLKTV